MKKVCVVILCIFVCVAANAQKNNTKMNTNIDTLFEKQLNDHIQVRQVLTESMECYILKTFLINQKLNKNVLIDVTMGNYVFMEKHPSQKYLSNYVYSRTKNSCLIDVCLKDKCIYMIKASSGNIIFKQITFKGEDKFETKEDVIGHSQGTMGIDFSGEMKDYRGYIFFNAKAYAHGAGGKGCNLFCNYDIQYNNITKYIFPEKTKLTIPDEKQIFKELDFEHPDSYSIISNAIKPVLIASGKRINQNDFKYLWCFDGNNYYRYDGGGVRDNGITYFFYQEIYPYSQVKVIRYDNYEHQWLLDDYKEKIINESN